MDVHRIGINLPAVCNADSRCPNPGKPLITIDGVELKGALSIKIEAAAENFTKVTLTFLAEVEGELDANDPGPAPRKDLN